MKGGAVIGCACVLTACSLALGEGEFVGGAENDAGANGEDASGTGIASDASTLPDGVSSDGGGDAGFDAPIDTGVDGDVPDPALVAHWKLDETVGTLASDSSSYGNIGAMIGSGAWTAGGKRNGAIVFDGASYIQVPNHPSMKIDTKLTVAFWLRVDTEVNNARAVSYGYGFDVKVNNGHPLLEMSSGYATANATIPVGQWHHVAFTFDSGTVVAYYDGFAVGFLANTLSNGATITQGVDATRLGRRIDDTFSLKGAMDDVRLYRRVLSSTEIAALAN